MASCRVEEGNYRGWHAAFLKNDLISLVAVPDIGGRIMAYDLGPYSYLYIDRDLAGRLFTPEENLGDGGMASWKNYGGDKTWPAPQGWDGEDQWPGPPDPVLDSGRYQLDELTSIDRSAWVRMVSPTGSPTGIQITRQAAIYANSSRVTLNLSFHNISSRPVRWSIWDVTQLRAERVDADGRLGAETRCVVSAPLNPHSRFPRGFQVMFGDQSSPQWQVDPSSGLFLGEYRWEIGKVGLDSRGGWAAFANRAAGYAFVARYTPFPDQEYPDDGADVEFWTVGRGEVAGLNYEHSETYLMECELLGPRRWIEPGEVTSLQIEWGACRCPGPIVSVEEAGCAGSKFRAVRQGDRVQLNGTFGVFDRGHLESVWLDEAGLELTRLDMGPVTPLEAVLLDCAELVPETARAVDLAVKTDEGVRLLAKAELS
jgi:hypothetical protein